MGALGFGAVVGGAGLGVEEAVGAAPDGDAGAAAGDRMEAWEAVAATGALSARTSSPASPQAASTTTAGRIAASRDALTATILRAERPHAPPSDRTPPGEPRRRVDVCTNLASPRASAGYRVHCRSKKVISSRASTRCTRPPRWERRGSFGSARQGGFMLGRRHITQTRTRARGAGRSSLRRLRWGALRALPHPASPPTRSRSAPAKRRSSSTARRSRHPT